LREHEVGLDEVRAHAVRHGVAGDGVLGQVGRGAAVGDDDLLVAARGHEGHVPLRATTNASVTSSRLRMVPPPAAIVGVSMGAIVGATYVLNPDWYRALLAADVASIPGVGRETGEERATRLRAILASGRALRHLLLRWGALTPARPAIEALHRDADARQRTSRTPASRSPRSRPTSPPAAAPC
jgi:hypothetical protein